eukprot:7390254-Prymnesium_polylepis.1
MECNAAASRLREAPIDCDSVLDRTPWKNRKPRKRLTKSIWVAVPYYSERGGQVPESETDPPRLRLYH